MKKVIRFGLIGAAFLLLFSATGCTANFCNVGDQAHMLYAVDAGITDYRNVSDIPQDSTSTWKDVYVTYDSQNIKIENVKCTTEISFSKNIESINAEATKNLIRLPSENYWAEIDRAVLEAAITKSIENGDITKEDIKNLTATQIRSVFDGENTGHDAILDKFGYLKFGDWKQANDPLKMVLWTDWDALNEYARNTLVESGRLNIDECPTSDYVALYKRTLNNTIAGYRSCLAIDTGYYGAYGPHSMPVEISAKPWTEWKGLLSFLLVWPIGAFIDVCAKGIYGMGVAGGWAQVLSIFIVTIIIRGIILLCTFKQTSSQARMNELQPEITKIQQKYPNANTNTYEKQRMAADMQKLYKKNKINPFGAIIVLIIQFPVFICVWGAMQGSAVLSTGSFLGLKLSDSIGSTMFNGASWPSGAGATALVLFILMAVAQAVSMLLPQWIQKKKQKEVARLGKNPAQKSQGNKMKWFTYIMLIMIIVMGFSLASGMGVYWLVGALFSIAQTLITEAISKRKLKKGKN